MNVTVLGCSGSIAKGCRTTSFLIDDDLLIDAGTGVGELELDAMARIDHILVSHSHLDHVLAIGLLADAVLRRRRAEGRPPIVVHALPQTLTALRRHIFNGVIWPDFTCLPDPQHPVLALRPFATGDRLEVAGKRVEVLPAAHTVPAVGFAVEHRGREAAAGSESGSGNESGNERAADAAAAAPRHWVFTGDTGPNPALWARLRTLRVSDLVIETAFADEEGELARLSRHLHPAALAAELAQLDGAVDVHITHVKPGELDAVMAEVARIETPHRVRALVTGEVLRLGTGPAPADVTVRVSGVAA